MSNQITGTVKAITQPVQRGTTVIQTVAVELPSQSQYPEIAVVEFVGKRYEKLKEKLDQLKIGQKVDIGFNYNGREYQGKWFGGLSGWKLFTQDGYQQQTPQQQVPPATGTPASF
tara:strand:- start:1255 stop:1599 length:345 start_codon:yes stop_codon:yes gene_type:complete